MGDRVAVIRKGVLQQVDTPQFLYDHPENLFVAGFIGSPAMNMVEADPRADRTGRRTSSSAGSDWPIPADVLASRPALKAYEGKQVIVGIRPEDMEDAVARLRRAGRPADPLARDPPGGARRRRARALHDRRAGRDHRGHEGARRTTSARRRSRRSSKARWPGESSSSPG